MLFVSCPHFPAAELWLFHNYSLKTALYYSSLGIHRWFTFCITKMGGKKASAEGVRCYLNPPVTLWLDASAALPHCMYSRQISRLLSSMAALLHVQVKNLFFYNALFLYRSNQQHLHKPMLGVCHIIFPEGALVSFSRLADTHIHPDSKHLDVKKDAMGFYLRFKYFCLCHVADVKKKLVKTAVCVISLWMQY